MSQTAMTAFSMGSEEFVFQLKLWAEFLGRKGRAQLCGLESGQGTGIHTLHFQDVSQTL